MNWDDIKDGVKEIGFAWLILAVIFSLGVFSGCGYGIKITKAEAVKQGHADWVANFEGEVTFKWKEAAK